MPSYHFAVQIIGRRPKHADRVDNARPQSAVAAAAYRARCAIPDERNGRVEDYRHKPGLQRTEILLPEGAAPWLGERDKLWNHVERLEKRSDAQLCREINMALPHELTDDQRHRLVRDFVNAEFVSRGMVADIAWHKPVPQNGDDPRNFHAHVMLTLRKATARGLHPVKTREWNSKELLSEWREAWRDHQNSWLREVGSQKRVDHRSLREQADDAWQRGDRRSWQLMQRYPEIHVGPRARQMVQRGYEPRSRDRAVGPPRRKYSRDPHTFGYISEAERESRREARRAERRTLRYSEFSYNTRLDYLTNILLANDRDLKVWLMKKDIQLARLSRKWDYWTNGLAWKAEGQIKGGLFRFQRAQQAAEERAAREVLARKKAHATKRTSQLRELKVELELALAALRGGREAVLARKRQVEAWRVRPERGQGRGPLWTRTPDLLPGRSR